VYQNFNAYAKNYVYYVAYKILCYVKKRKCIEVKVRLVESGFQNAVT
jgi:hypothetical protein